MTMIVPKDDNITREYLGLRLWNINPKLAFAIADVVRSCEENGRFQDTLKPMPTKRGKEL